jgi:phosphate-selective porin OprO and OprP
MQSGRFLRRTLVGLALASVAVAGFPDPLRAEPRREPSRAELEERIRRLEKIIEERGLDKPAAKPSAAAAAEAGPPVDKAEVEAIVDSSLKKQKMLAGWKDGFFLESPSGDFKLKLRGYVQADARVFPNNGGDTGFNNFTLRRVRPILEGTVYKYFDYKIMPDFGGGTATIQDAWGGINYWPEARFRAGKFKPPVSLERLQSGSDLLFVERSLTQNLVPNRDVGFQLAGDFWDSVLSYQIGVFNGTIDGGSNDNDVTSEKEFAGRIFAEPAKKSGIAAVKGMGIGVAGMYGDANNADSLSPLQYRTPARSTFFKFDTSSTVSIVQDDEHHRIAPQAYWYWGPFSAMGEYIFSKQGAKRTDSATGLTTKAQLDNAGWFAEMTYVLTGEDASYKGVAPKNNFDPRNGQWGAFELSARGSMLEVDEDAFDLGFASEPTSAAGAQNFGLGVNWYLNRAFKFMVGYERTWFDTPVSFSGTLRDKEDVILTRFQIAY